MVKKIEKKEKLENQKEQKKITIEEVEARLNQTEWKKYFKNIYSGGSGGTGGFFLNSGSLFVNDPYLLNKRIKELKTSPSFLSREEIEQALIEPEYNELALRIATHEMIYMSYPLYRLNYLYEGILTYKSYIHPLYVEKSDMTKKRFKSDWKFVDMWEKKLNPKKQFRRIVAEVVAEGKRAYYLRQSYNNSTGNERVNYVHFQELPSNWYKIIKHSTDSHAVVAFNFAYFWEAGTTLGQFPKIFEDYYKDLMNATDCSNGRRSIDKNKVSKNAIIEYNSETMEWFYWMELPSDQCFVFSFTEADDLQVSPFISLLLQAQDLGSYSLLQQQLLTIPLYSMILGELPMNDGKDRGGSHVDDYKLSPEAVGVFESKVNASMPPGTNYSIVPSKNNEIFSFQEIPNANNIYNTGLQQLINTSGASTLMTTTEKPSVAQVKAGQIIEKRFIDRIYDQFAWAVNIILSNMYDDGDLTYRWFFKIFGDSFSDKDSYDQIEKSLTFGQTEMLPYLLAYKDKSLLDAVTTADWVNSSKIYDKFKPMINSYTSSSKQTDNSSSVGRPKADENSLKSDSTDASIGSGQNTGDMKDV